MSNNEDLPPVDIAALLEKLVPSAEFKGSLTANTEEAFNAIRWEDERPQPSWAELLVQAYRALEEYQVYAYRSSPHDVKSEWPGHIDFLTGLDRRLLPKNTFVFGELRQTTYYQTRDADGCYHTPVVRETFEYIRDPDTQFPISRTNTIQWYFIDGTLDSRSKVLSKVYDDDSVSCLNELARRRDNNIKNTIGAIMVLALRTDPQLTRSQIITEGQTFFNQQPLNRALYIQDGNLALVDDVRADSTLLWFDNDISGFTPFPTIRSYVIYQLTNGAETE